MSSRQRHSRFHGRIGSDDQPCAVPGCAEPGEFRAPDPYTRVSGDGPGRWRYMCLDHVREFNAGYDYFAGLSDDEIYEAQHPVRGWDSQRRVYNSGPTVPPAWADFVDPLDAIGARFARSVQRPRPDGKPISSKDLTALKTLGLGEDATRSTIRKAYSQLVRKYHPDRNGGDRAHEKRLAKVISAYTHLKQAAAFQ